MPGEAASHRRLLGCVAPAVSLTPPTVPPVSPATRRTMQANRGRDTGPERALRSALHQAGMRFRVDLPLPFDRRRRADIVFTRIGLYVFVDGCFWHGCPQHFVMPKTRSAFWQTKIEGNRARDADTDRRLAERGLVSLRIWEHVEAVEAAQMVRDMYARSTAARTGTEPA